MLLKIENSLKNVKGIDKAFVKSVDKAIRGIQNLSATQQTQTAYSKEILNKSSFKRTGWVSENDLLTKTEWSQFKQAISDIKLNKNGVKIKNNYLVTTYDSSNKKADISFVSGIFSESGKYSINKEF